MNRQDWDDILGLVLIGALVLLVFGLGFAFWAWRHIGGSGF